MALLLRIVIIVLILFASGNLFASDGNNLQFSHFTKENGLSDNVITTILQDNNGIIWIGTKDGVHVYNGYEFLNYRHSDFDSTSLIGSEVHHILLCNDNDIVIATNRGVSKFFENERLFKPCPFIINGKPGNVYTDDLFKDQQGRIFAFAKDSVWLLDSEKLVFNYYNPISKSLIGFNEVYGDGNALFIDRANTFWLGGQKGLMLCRENNEPIMPFYEQCLKEINKHNPRVQSIKLLYNSVMCVSTSEGVFLMKEHQDKQELEHIFKGIDIVSTYNEDSILWAATKGDGLYRYNLSTKNLTKFRHKEYNPWTIASNSIKSIFRDKQNNLWVGTFANGISVAYNQSKKFNAIRNLKGSNNGISSNYVHSLVFDDQHNLWISTSNGLNKFNTQTKEISYYLHNETKPNTPAPDAMTIAYKDGEIYGGGWGSGVYMFNIKSKNSVNYWFNQTNHHLHNFVRNIYVDSKGEVWATSDSKGIKRYSKKQNCFVDFTTDDSLMNKYISNISATKFYEDSKGQLWLGKFDGVAIIDVDRGLVKPLSEIVRKSDKLVNNWVFSFLESAAGNMYIGTAGGLSIYNPITKSIKNLTEKDGLVHNFIHVMHQDKNGFVWIGTKNGLSCYNPINGAFTNYKDIDGLAGNEIGYSALAVDDNGIIYIGGQGGVTYFNPNEIKQNEYIPPVVISDFQVNYKPMVLEVNSKQPESNLCAYKQIKLKYSQKILNIKFTALNYINPLKNQYSYMLEGFDTEFTKPGTKREATYTNLDAGNYVFRVKASNNDGVWNEEGACIAIKIMPPWWKTWYFRIGLVLFIVILAWFFYLMRVKVLKDQKKVLEIKVKQRTEELEIAYVELENKQKEIQQHNEKLLASEQELQQLNEELSATNDQLYNQKEELETTLNNLKETQSQLVQSEKMASLGILTSGIAHEINNPLNFIQGGKTNLQFHIEDNYPNSVDAFKPFLNMIDEGVKRAANIVKSLGRFNRTNDNYEEECSIHEIINNCLLMITCQVDYEIKINKSYELRNFVVIGNEGELHQVFLNILTNASQAIINNGVISIETEIINEKTGVIKISDNGKGIDPEHISKVTSPFFTTKDPGKGTGLGMSIAYSIIKKHDGSIQYASQPGRGTTVTLTFPIQN